MIDVIVNGISKFLKRHSKDYTPSSIDLKKSDKDLDLLKETCDTLDTRYNVVEEYISTSNHLEIHTEKELFVDIMEKYNLLVPYYTENLVSEGIVEDFVDDINEILDKLNFYTIRYNNVRYKNMIQEVGDDFQDRLCKCKKLISELENKRDEVVIGHLGI